MTKFAMVFLGISLATLSALANQCAGDILFDSVFADLVCKAGHCSGYIPAQKVLFKGTCKDETNFAANGLYVPTYVKGTCTEGVVYFSANSQRLDLYGDCNIYDEVVGAFSSFVYSPAYSGSGYCQENGMSRIFFAGGLRPFSGDCHK